MSERGQPKLVNIAGRRKLYVQWTPPRSRRTKVVSTGIEGSQDAPPAEAERFLDRFIADLDAPPEDPTLGELLDARLSEAKGRVLAHKKMGEFHAQIKARIGSLKPADWTPRRNAKYIQDRGSDASARRELQELRSAFLLHARTDRAFEAPEVTYPGPSEPRDDFLDQEDAPRLLAAAKSRHHIYLFILIAMVSGQRKGAILDLTWKRVDLKRGILDFRKPGRRRTKKRRGIVPIGSDVVAELRMAREIAKSGYVVEWGGRQVKDIKKGFALAVDRAGLAVWCTPHVLKHSVISWLGERGYNEDKTGDLTSTDPRTVRRIYRKVNPESLKPMADELAEVVFAAPKSAEVPTLSALCGSGGAV